MDAIGWLATDSVTPETTYKFYCADLIQYLSVVMLCKHFCLAGKRGKGG